MRSHNPLKTRWGSGPRPVEISTAAARIAAIAPPGRIPLPINRLTAPLLRAVVNRRVRSQMRTALTNFDGDIVEDSVAGVRVTRRATAFITEALGNAQQH